MTKPVDIKNCFFLRNFIKSYTIVWQSIYYIYSYKITIHYYSSFKQKLLCVLMTISLDITLLLGKSNAGGSLLPIKMIFKEFILLISHNSRKMGKLHSAKFYSISPIKDYPLLTEYSISPNMMSFYILIHNVKYHFLPSLTRISISDQCWKTNCNLSNKNKKTLHYNKINSLIAMNKFNLKDSKFKAPVAFHVLRNNKSKNSISGTYLHKQLSHHISRKLNSYNTSLYRQQNKSVPNNRKEKLVKFF